MARTVVLPINDYPTGTRVIPEFAIADSVTTGTLELARCTTATPTIWPNADTTVKVALEISLDGRATWQGAGESSDRGGIAFEKDGVTEKPISRHSWGWTPGTGRFIRGAVTITNGPLRTSVTADLI